MLYRPLCICSTNCGLFVLYHHRTVQAYFAKIKPQVENNDVSRWRKISKYFFLIFRSIFPRLFWIQYTCTVRYRTSKWRSIELWPALPVQFYASKMLCAVLENTDRIHILYRFHRYSPKQRKASRMTKLDQLRRINKIHVLLLFGWIIICYNFV